MMKRLSLLVTLLFAWVILTSMLVDDRRFQPDEAFFMTFARHAAVGGDWWLQGSLDKPSLTLYANALAIAFIGADPLPDGVLTLDPIKGEFVGRLVSVWSGIVLITLAMRLALDFSRRTWCGLVVGVVLATLPMIRLYSASAFMDMPMLMLALAAVWLAYRSQAATAGVLLACAFAAKPQAIFMAPLIVWFVWTRGTAYPYRRLIAFAAALLVGLGTLLVWDAARPGDSVFALGAANNNFFAPTPDPTLLVQRLTDWLPTMQLSQQPIYPGLLGVLLSAGLVLRRTRAISLWSILYVLAHLILFDTLYERYLLLPLVLTSIAVPVVIFHLILPQDSVEKRKQRRFLSRCKIAGIGLIAVSVPCWAGAVAESEFYYADLFAPIIKWYPIQALEDYDDDPAQIDLLANDLNALPTATVIYDHWLGWLLKYYMGEWQDKRIVYYPSPEAMAADARALPETQPRYLLMPMNDIARYGLSSPWSEKPEAFVEALSAAGFELVGTQTHGFVTIRLNPPR